MTAPEAFVARRSSTPPLIPFALTIGVTGHRLEGIEAEAVEGVEARVADALDLLASEARALATREAALFADGPPILTMVSPLAEGADQIAAAAALAQGYRLQAILPFERSVYSTDFTNAGRARFEQLVAQASCLLELPGVRNDAHGAYVDAGRATVAHCDVLIAVWDGLAARGRGGTAEIVELALSRGTPIVHLPIDLAEPPTLLWSAFDPIIVTNSTSAATRRPLDRAAVGRMLALSLAPPESQSEREDLRHFLAERDRRLRARIEYPLMLTIAGTHRFGRGDWTAAPGVDATRTEWVQYRAACAGCHGVAADLDMLEAAYGWSDRLASHFAQNYRSGHVFNFLLGALAVLIALTGLLFPGAKLMLTTTEFVVILAILINTLVGVRTRWHQRWLDYRQLAEKLRPMRSLKLLGIAAPDAPGSDAEPVARRWTDWYAAGIWRTMGCPSGRIDAARAQALAKSIAEHEIGPQIAYNRSSAEKVGNLDHRLEWISAGLFAATIIGCAIMIGALLLAPEWANRYSKLYVWLLAGLPALGTAIFGIKVQGDFCGTALRSRATADLLERIARDLDLAGPDLARSANLAEQAARVMLADLGQWRLVNEQHELAIG